MTTPAAKSKKPKKVNFTVKSLAEIPIPKTGRTYRYDTLVRGLAVCVTSTGARSFYLYRKVQGRPERIRLADAADITIAQARDMASKKNEIIAQGGNPQREKIEARAEPTFGELFTAYLEGYKRPRKPKSAPQDEANYNLHLAQWKNRRLSEITHAEVAKLHTTIGRDRPYLANRLLSLISAMYNARRTVGIVYDGQNPAEGIERFNEEKREKYLTPEQLGNFFEHLAKLRYQTTADFFRFALFTGQRRGNIQTMRWEHVDLAAGVWNIPDTKANRPHIVPLTAEALAVLAARKAGAGESPWVFPSPKSASGHLVEPKTAWQELTKNAGLEGYRIHDLRHTLASWMAANNTSLIVIGKGLGHSQPATTARYAHIATDPVRAAMATVTAAMIQPRYRFLRVLRDTLGWCCLTQKAMLAAPGHPI